MAHEGRAEEVEAGPPEWLQVKSCKDSNSGGDSNSQKYNKEKPVRSQDRKLKMNQEQINRQTKFYNLECLNGCLSMYHKSRSCFRLHELLVLTSWRSFSSMSVCTLFSTCFCKWVAPQSLKENIDRLNQDMAS